MCNFFWKSCFCCNSFTNAYSDSEFCGSVDCNINNIFPKVTNKYCNLCIQKQCNKKKTFCNLMLISDVLTLDKSMNRLTLFLEPSN